MPASTLSTCPISIHLIGLSAPVVGPDPDTAPVTPFDLVLTVDPGAGVISAPVRLVLELPGPVLWSEVADAVRAAAGLPPDTELHLGPGPVLDEWLVGAPPLLTSVTLTTRPADTAPIGGTLRLCCLAGPDAGRSVPVLGADLIVGRDRTADLALDDPDLSFQHARLGMGAAGPVLTDLGSTNGSTVDGRQARDGPTPVPAGAVIRTGASLLQVRLAAEPGLAHVPDGRGRLRVTRPARLAARWSPVLPDDPGAPPARTRRPIPVVAAVVGGILGAALAAVTGSPMFLLLAGLGPVTMLATAVADRIGGRRSHRRVLAEYRERAAAWLVAVENAVDADRRDSWDRHPDPARCLLRAERVSARLWERRPGGPEFAVLTVGVGSRPARLPMSDPPMVTEVPVTIDLTATPIVGIAGDAAAVLRALLVQVAALHSPADLTLVLPFGDPGPLADLPHLRPAEDPGAFELVVLPDAQLHRETTAAWAVPATHRAVLCTAPTRELLPGTCSAVLEVRGRRLVVTDAAGSVQAEPLGVAPRVLAELCAALAPLADGAAGAANTGTGPACIDAGGPLRPAPSSPPAPPDLTESWLEPRAAAILGVGPAGPVELDLDRDGPHLLVAGTTGSGKSELLATLVAGLAAAAPPTVTSFVLIDYKGGAGFADLARLPHTAGLITDLDPALAERGLASLRAEVRRRERVLAAAGVVDLAALRTAGAADLPPRLVIVVDEFATLAADLPGFLTGLVDIAQRGRSLGLHLVLATQRPAGVVSPAIRANSAARICLRVLDDSDSRDVIDVPDAARLPTQAPGRALLRTGRERIVAFQAARITVSPRTRLRVRRADQPRIPETGPTALDLLIDAATAAAVGLPPTAPPWLPPLPRRLQLADPQLLGLADHPDEQAQRPVPVPPGSLLVTGPAGSGRSTALHRWAHAAAVAGADLLLIDAGHGLAGPGAWSATATRLDGCDPTLVLRLIARVADEVGRRGGRPGRPMALVLDDWDAVSGPLDQLDYGSWSGRLADIAARGPACGIRVAVAGGLRLQHHRFAASCAATLLLGAPNARGEPRPDAPPGRGRWSAGGPEVQVALPPPGPPVPVSSPAPDRGAGVTEPIVVRPLPTLVRARDLAATFRPTGRAGPHPVVDADFESIGSHLLGSQSLGSGRRHPAGVPIGLGGDAAEPVGPDLHQVGALLVAGPPRSGVSTTLLTLATGASQVGLPVVRLLLRAEPACPGVIDLDLRAGATALQQLLSAHQGPLVLLADRADDLAENAAADLLTRYLSTAVSGQILVLGSRLDRAVRATRGLIAEAAAHRCGVLLQADGPDGRLLDVTLPRRRGPLPAGRGHLVLHGSATPIQIAVGE